MEQKRYFIEKTRVNLIVFKTFSANQRYFFKLKTETVPGKNDPANMARSLCNEPITTHI